MIDDNEYAERLEVLAALRANPTNIGGRCAACDSRNVAWTLLKDNGGSKEFHGVCGECGCSFDINSL